MKKIIVLLLTLLMLLSLAACGAEPAEEDKIVAEPQSEQEVVVNNENAVDEISEPIVETENSTEPTPALLNENELKENNEVEEEGIPAEEQVVSSDNSDSNPFGGLATYKGKLVRAYPAGYKVDNLWNAQIDELVYIGDVLYQGSAGVWSVKDTSTPPENYVPTDGSIGMRDFNGSPHRVFPEDYDRNMMLPTFPFEMVYIGDVVYGYNDLEWVMVDTSVPPNQYTIIPDLPDGDEIVFR